VDCFLRMISTLGCVKKCKVIVLLLLHSIISILCNYVIMILIYLFMVEIIIKLHACFKFEIDG
jgi:hypothetical protein